MADKVYKVNNTSYTIRREGNVYTLFRQLSTAAYVLYYQQRQDEIVHIDAHPWLRLFSCDTEQKAIACLGPRHA